MRAGVLTASDRCAAGLTEDRSGPLITSCLARNGFAVVHQSVVSDDRSAIESTLKDWSDNSALDLIVTTGGTGFTPRDVTPDATRAVVDREATGISVALIAESLKATPMAMISRLTAGIRGRTLIVNFPGSPKACEECFATVEPVLKHAIHQLSDNRSAIEETHQTLQPKNKSIETLVLIVF